MRKSMYHRAVLVALVMAFIFGMAAPGFAFDKERKGFILGFGLGPGFTSYSETRVESGQDDVTQDGSKFSFLSNFKIGYAPSNQLMVYWLSNVAWYGIDTSVEMYYDGDKESYLPYNDVTLLSGVGGIGVTYFFRPKAPSIFVTAGAGLSAMSLPFEGTDTRTGLGISGGIGYEFARNWCLEASVIWGDAKRTLEESEYDEYNGDFLGFGLTINVLGY
nr:hypothetical protein [candidate division Zixibacteria bacterium]